MYRSSTTNLHRRSKFLFRFPSTRKSSLLLGLTGFPIAYAIVEAGLGKSNDYTLLTIPLGMIFISVLFERLLFIRNPLATFRRLSGLSAISNCIWVFSIACGILVNLILPSKDRLLPIVLFGFFLAVSFKLAILGSLFFDRLYYAIPAAFIQPSLAVSPLIVTPIFMESGLTLLLPTIGGMLIVGSVAAYLFAIDNFSKWNIKTKPLSVLRAFVVAWATGRVEKFEDIMEESSTYETVGVKSLSFESESSKTTIIIPEVHPGPFYPIGSSNLPYEIFKKFNSKNSIPVIVHGISGHEQNLPSKREVERFLNFLQQMNHITSAARCSEPRRVTVGHSTATGLAFEDTALVMITLSPHGMEDFPLRVKKEVEEIALRARFKHTVIIDCHNSQGTTLTEEECDSAVEACRRLLEELRNLPQYPFKVGAAHSEKSDVSFGRDVGPGGVSLLVLEINGGKYGLAAFDSNNAERGLREKIMNVLSNNNFELLEICTSDTHITAGKVLDDKGYAFLGQYTNVDTIVSILTHLRSIALGRILPSKLTLKSISQKSKVLGFKALDDFSVGIDRITPLARRGAFIIAFFSLCVLIATALL